MLFALTEKVCTCIAADLAILCVHSVCFYKTFLTSKDLAWILISPLMRHDTCQMPFLLVYNAFTKSLVDSI